MITNYAEADNSFRFNRSEQSGALRQSLRSPQLKELGGRNLPQFLR